MKKKLLLITPIFPQNKEDDTIVPFIYQFCNYFDQEYSNLQIDIITLRYPQKKGIYTINNLTIYAIGGGFKNKWNTIKVISKAINLGLTLFKKNNYDGVLSFWYTDTTLIGKILKKLYKTPHFTWMQGQDIKTTNKYLKLFKPNPEELIFVGKNHNLLFNKYHKTQIDKIANVAVDPATFPPLNIDRRTIDIIGIGNLGALKNYSLFIEIIYELRKKYPNINAVICGDGEEMELLTNKIKALQLQKNIKLMGYVNNKEVRGLMNTSTILLHTSQFEGNSMVVQEALYSGCKVVSTIPLQEDIPNFFYKEDKTHLISTLQKVLEEKKTITKRIRYFKIEDTAKTIYDSFFESK